MQRCDPNYSLPAEFVVFPFALMEQGVDVAFFGDSFDKRRIAIAFGFAAAPTFVLDLAIQSSQAASLADDPATQLLIDMKLGYIGEFAGATGDEILKAWDMLKNAFNQAGLPPPPEE